MRWKRPLLTRARLKRCSLGLLPLLLLPPTVVAQEDARVTATCLSCEPHGTVPLLAPGSLEARRAILEPLARQPVSSLDIRGPTSLQDASSLGCGKLALIAGTVMTAAGLLLAFLLDSAVPWDGESSATSLYLVTGGVAFGVGATYAYVRCRIERR
jgi:hypothetical protein